MKRYSRDQFVRRGALAVGGAAGLGLLHPAAAFARAAGDPRPIPGGFDDTFTPVPSNPVHPRAAAPGRVRDVDDHRLHRCCRRAGDPRSARGSDGSVYGFDTDMRFMQGTYVGLDGRLRKGSFGFI